MGLESLEIRKNCSGYYDVFLNGEKVLGLIGENEIETSVMWVMNYLLPERKEMGCACV